MDNLTAKLIQENKTLKQRVRELEAEEIKRHRMKAALAENKRRYERLIWHLTDYIYTVTIKRGKVVDTYHGPGCVAVTGYTPNEYVLDPSLWIRMVHEEDREFVTKQAQDALQGIQPKPIEHRIIHKDKSVRWLRNTIVLRKDDKGRMISYDGLISDITDRKKAEREARLKQRQLIQADKMVSLGILVSGIAHEINNPNNFIKLNGRLLSRVWHDVTPILDAYYKNNGDFSLAGMPYSEEFENLSRAVAGIERGAQRIQEIVKSLKSFARKDTGDLNQPIKINDVVYSAIELLQNMIKKTTDHFELRLQEGLPTIKGNSQQLEQVMVNVLMNACQSLESRDKELGIISLYDEEQRRNLIQVYDAGVGIPQKDIDRIVDPFFTTKRDSDGTGLGLSISYQIVTNHGGDMYFDSELGEGTTVTISLPIYE